MHYLKVMGYDALELVTRRRGISRRFSDENIRFPVRWCRYYERDYEPETFRFLRTHINQGSTFFDIGAHIGLFSVFGATLASPTGKVFSFEPTPSTREVLTDVIRLNGYSDIVEIRPEAVAAGAGKAVFWNTINDVSNANSLVKSDRGIVGVEVEVISLDEFVEKGNLKPNCMKIDVEGAELDLLRGARETFMKFRPPARLGLHPSQIGQNGQSLEEIWYTLEEFRLTVEFEGNKVDKQWFCSQDDLFDVNLLPN